jgi:hypothetical protein
LPQNISAPDTTLPEPGGHTARFISGGDTDCGVPIRLLCLRYCAATAVGVS